MEEEAHFLYIAYYTEQGSRIGMPDGKEKCLLHALIKRATIRRPDRGTPQWEGFSFERTPIEFDPSGKQQGYVVAMYTGQEDGSRAFIERGVTFIQVTVTEEEANQIKKEIEKGAYKNHLDKKERFSRVEVQPILISQI